jgi:hypothetical protein
VSVWVIAQENVGALPFVCLFAMCVFCVALLAARRHPTLGLALLAWAALARLEYAAVLLPASLWWGFDALVRSYTREPRKCVLRRPDAQLLCGLVGFALVLCLAASKARGQGERRSWLAFAQHYALAQSAAGRFHGSPWLDYESVMRSDFGDADSLLGVALGNPTRFSAYVAENVGKLGQVALSTFESASALSMRSVLGPFVLQLTAAVFLALCWTARWPRAGANFKASVHRLTAGTALLLCLGPMVLVPSVLVSAPAPRYFVLALPSMLWPLGAALTAALDALRDTRLAQLRAAPLALFGLVSTLLWVGPRPYDGRNSVARHGVQVLKKAAELWPKRQVIVAGSHATFYSNYLGRERAIGFEALPASYGGATPPGGVGIDDLLGRYRANAVLVNPELTNSRQFRANTLAILYASGWVPKEIEPGETIYFAPSLLQP